MLFSPNIPSGMLGVLVSIYLCHVCYFTAAFSLVNGLVEVCNSKFFPVRIFIDQVCMRIQNIY